MLRGISKVDMSLSLFGEKISMPICMAPVGVQAMANTMAERASAQGIILTLAFRGGGVCQCVSVYVLRVFRSK